MSNIGYVRVSTVQQNTDRQLAGVDLDRVFEEKISGASMDRPELKAMMDYVREGDTVHVHELSRLGRNVKDVLTIVDAVKEKGASIRFHKEGITVGEEGAGVMGNFMLNILASVAEMERVMMLERQREGYEAAKAAGRITGRGNGKAVDRAGIKAAIDAGASVRAVAAQFGVSTNTVFRIKKEAEC